MKYKILLYLCILVSLVGCKDYLDLVPEKDLETIETVFEKRTQAIQFMTSCYKGLQATNQSLLYDPGMLAADEFVPGPNAKKVRLEPNFLYLPGTKIARGQWNTEESTLGWWGSRASYYNTNESNMYKSIRYCNIVIDRIEDVYDMTDSEKEIVKAEAKALKATYYYYLVKMYGAIPLVPTNIDVDEDVDKMNVPRSPLDTCIKRIVDLYDEAIPKMLSCNAQPTNEYGRIHAEAAASFKAKALLLAASPLFNGNAMYDGMTNKEGEALFANVYDADKWKVAAQACDEAVEMAEAAGKYLNSGTSSFDTELLNKIYDIQYSVISPNWDSKELIFGQWVDRGYAYMHYLPRYPNAPDFNDGIFGDLGVSLRTG